MSWTCGPVKWSSIAVLRCLVIAFLPSLIIRPLPSANNSIMVPTKRALSDNQMNNYELHTNKLTMCFSIFSSCSLGHCYFTHDKNMLYYNFYLLIWIIFYFCKKESYSKYVLFRFWRIWPLQAKPLHHRKVSRTGDWKSLCWVVSGDHQLIEKFQLLAESLLYT